MEQLLALAQPELIETAAAVAELVDRRGGESRLGTVIAPMPATD